MKLFLSVEEAARAFRRGLISHLQKYAWFRKATLLALPDDIVLVTKQFHDHQLIFAPRETIGRDLYRKGHYQRDLASRVLQLVGPLRGKTLLEVGANIGTHTVYLMLSGKFERAICIEPDPRNFNLLKQNLELNDFSDVVAAFQYAAGDREGSINLYFGDDNFGASTVIKPRKATRSVSVQLRRVDSIMAEAGIGPDDIGLVWMDIEGAEPEALDSMAELTKRRVPILMEYSPQRYGAAKVRKIIDLAGNYRRCIVFGRSESEMDIRDVTEQRDVLLLP